MDDSDGNAREEISLLDSLSHEWLKLPLSIMRDVGPAVQTLGGILRVASKETFVAARAIAEKSRLPVPTARKHLVTLHERGWILNEGRGRTRAGRARRTCTITLTAKTKAAMSDYGILPWWACCYISRIGRLPWSAKMVLSVIMARLAAFKAAIERQEGYAPDDEDFWGTQANMGGEGRFRYSLHYLEKETGLHRESIVDAKRRLAKLGIIDWIRGDDGCDLLCPNAAFRVVVTPTTEGHCTLAFAKGSETGQ